MVDFFTLVGHITCSLIGALTCVVICKTSCWGFWDPTCWLAWNSPPLRAAWCWRFTMDGSVQSSASSAVGRGASCAVLWACSPQEHAFCAWRPVAMSCRAVSHCTAIQSEAGSLVCVLHLLQTCSVATASDGAGLLESIAGVLHVTQLAMPEGPWARSKCAASHSSGAECINCVPTRAVRNSKS